MGLNIAPLAIVFSSIQNRATNIFSRMASTFVSTNPSFGELKSSSKTGDNIGNSSASSIAKLDKVSKQNIQSPTGTSSSSVLRVATWNIAAINNNPFEYWVTYDDPSYNKLMNDVQIFINDPKEADTTIGSIFSEEMFQQLKHKMILQGWNGVEETEMHWNNDLKKCKIVSGFLKNRDLGAKRLISMPDRMTNTIDIVKVNQETSTDASNNESTIKIPIPQEGRPGKLYRPTAINCYPGTFSNVQDWWTKWITFMFDTPFDVYDAKKAKSSTPSISSNVLHRPSVVSVLKPISRAKYPLLTEEEEKISVPLQVLCIAIFDSILINMLERIAPSSTTTVPNVANLSTMHTSSSWQSIRHKLSEALNSKKIQRTLEILSTEYGDQDIIFLQEVASSFLEEMTIFCSTSQSRSTSTKSLSQIFHVIRSSQMTGRDQNSIILVRKSLFDVNSIQDVTKEVNKMFTKGERTTNEALPTSPGDLLVVTLCTTSKKKNNKASEEKYILASFHGDTNGLITIPVVDAVHQYYTAQLNQKKKEEKYEMGIQATTGGGNDLALSTKATTTEAAAPVAKEAASPEPNQGVVKLIFGLDANTYVTHVPGKRQGVTEFAQWYHQRGFTSCWHQCQSLTPVNTSTTKKNDTTTVKSLLVNPTNYTTFNARTFLQPQLNKACGKDEFLNHGDVNPKDFLLFYTHHFSSVSHVSKDNTGHKKYVENMVFPTLTFPSDHAIVSAHLHASSKL